MMYVAKCPLRISLVGGSTDLESFIKTYGRGAVISFPSNLYCYISIHKNNRGKYIINYSKKEEVDSFTEIKNDVARVVLEHFEINEPVTISFNTDIFADGSGLATSSAYTIACVKAVSLYKGIRITEFEACNLALQLERKFNPLTGYQDPYGCGIGGFKRMDFVDGKRPQFKFFDSTTIVNHYDMFLVESKKQRSSTSILTGINTEKSRVLLQDVEDLELAIESNNFKQFEKIMKEAWEKKKLTSSSIIGDEELLELERKLISVFSCIKLCGAGGGGYFLCFSEKNASIKDSAEMISMAQQTRIINITMNDTGVQGMQI